MGSSPRRPPSPLLSGLRGRGLEAALMWGQAEEPQGDDAPRADPLSVRVSQRGPTAGRRAPVLPWHWVCTRVWASHGQGRHPDPPSSVWPAPPAALSPPGVGSEAPRRPQTRRRYRPPQEWDADPPFGRYPPLTVEPGSPAGPCAPVAPPLLPSGSPALSRQGSGLGRGPGAGAGP